MSIYQQVMGKEFNRLHPMLQKRYESSSFQANGVMKRIQGGPAFLYPFFWFGIRWKLLFPEHGVNIPFTITNTARIGTNGEQQVHWERIFYFNRKKRYFNALMSLDKERSIIKDYLGEPQLVYSDLALTATHEGALHIVSGSQRLVLGKLEIPLPKLFQGLATVTENYIVERRVFHIHVTVNNPLIGTVFAYEGEFTANDIA